MNLRQLVSAPGRPTVAMPREAMPPAGQAQPADPPAAGRPAPAPLPTAGAPTPELSLGPDGRIQGLDGVLDQIGEALTRQLVPVLRDTAIPMILRDRELQRTIGTAAGAEVGRRMRPYLLAGIGISLFAVYLAYRKKDR